MPNGYALRWRERYVLSVTTSATGQADLYVHSVNGLDTHLHAYDSSYGSGHTIGISLKDQGRHPDRSFAADLSAPEVIGRIHLTWDSESSGVSTQLSVVGPASTSTAYSLSNRPRPKTPREERELPYPQNTELELEILAVPSGETQYNADEVLLDFGGEVGWGLLLRPRSSSKM